MSNINIEFRGYPLEIEILYYTPGNDGVTSGPPEHCFPDEGPELDWQIVEDEDTLLSTLLYENYEEEITSIILSDIEQEQVNQLEEEGDAKYEAMKDAEYD